MKKIFTILFITLIFLNPISAYANNAETLKAIETNIFGYDYSNEADSKRIERIETHLYGAKKSGNIKQRLENIQNDSGFTIVEKQPEKVQITPNQVGQPTQNGQTVVSERQQQLQEEQRKRNQALASLKEDSSVEYPMVDKLEKEIFSTTYKNDSIYTRLDRLEQQVFNKVSNQDLNTRVDRLAAVVRPKNVKYNNNYQYSSQDMDNYYSNSGLEPINDQSMPFQLAALEQDLLRNEFMNENNSNRLSRLEQKLFKRTFATDSDITRLQRIMVAYDAKKNSSRYDNNRSMQNMATASQIGGLLLMILAILL